MSGYELAGRATGSGTLARLAGVIASRRWWVIGIWVAS
jgi:hypothetical protein